MAEAEDVITDAALHATSFVQGLWRRHRVHAASMPGLALSDVAQRLDLLIVAVFGRACPLRTAQGPARATFLARTFQPQERPRLRCAIPATDGTAIWLPAEAGVVDAVVALERFRTAALRQAMRVARGSAAGVTPRRWCATSTCCSRPMPLTRTWPACCPACGHRCRSCGRRH